jgi:replicative DNA helicase
VTELGLPQSTEAERSVLGAVLVENKHFQAVADLLTADDFYRSAHRHVFEAMVRVTSRGQPIDLLTITESLEGTGLLETVGGIVFLSQLMDGIPKLVNAEHYARIVKDRSVRRQLVGKAGVLESDARMGDEPAEDIVSNMVRSLSSMDLGQSVEVEPTEKLLESYMDALQARQEGSGGLRGLDTGFESVNERTGGLPFGGLSILAARPSQGKSSFAMCLSRHVMRTHGVIVFQLESPAHEFMERLLSYESGVDSMRLRYATSKHPLREFEWHKLVQGFKSLSDDKRRLRVVVQPHLTVGQVAAVVRTTKREWEKRGSEPLRLVVVDYVQLMAGQGRSRQEEVASVSRGLKVLASSNPDVAFLVCCAVRREDPKQTRGGIPPFPGLSELKESGSLEQDGDLIFAIQRKEFYLRLLNKSKGHPEGDVGEEEGWADVGILKQRQGPIGRWRMRFWAATTAFGDPVQKHAGQGQPNDGSLGF